jgi:hypothetical protein
VAHDIREVIGSKDGLRFEIAPSDQDLKFPGLAWLRVSVWLGDTQVWSQSDEQGHDSSVDWTWVDFLSGLARAWPWLMLEDSYPIPVQPMHPGELVKATQLRWSTLPNTVSEQEEDALFDFKMCHDLSQFMRGIFLSPLWVLLEGKEYLLWSPNLVNPICRASTEVRATLEQFGDYLCSQLKNSMESRAIQANDTWKARLESINREFLPLASGLSRTELQDISGHSSPEGYFEIDSANDPICWLESNELLAAARMTAGFFPLRAQKILIEYVRQSPSCKTPELDQLTNSCPDLREFGAAGYMQGYALATWLRAQMRIAETEPVDCEALLSRWGVHLQDVSLPEAPGLDALAVWGPKRGPAIFLNVAQLARPTTRNGRRTTVAHEICHMICDRQGALPLVEVLGGQVPRHQEQRARAFAAELLLPRSVAAAEVTKETDVVHAADRLAQEFKVSRELVRWQITNSPAIMLSASEKTRLEDWEDAIPWNPH